MNIFSREMKANLKSLLIWCSAQFFVIFSGMVKYSGYANSKIDINTLFQQFPKGLMAVFGIGEVDMSKIEGFYSMFFLFFMLLAAIHASTIGAVIISKEERDHSADFLFAKPVTRGKVITAKLAAGLVNVLIFNLVTLTCSLYFISLYNHGNPIADKVIIIMIALLIFQVLFLCIGSALGALIKTTRKATSWTSALLLGTFFLSIGIDIDKRIEFLKYVTPFKYFEAKSLMFGGAFQASSLIISAGLIGICLFVTYVQYGKRDLTT